MMERYSRQMLFDPIGEIGQNQISSTRILLVGAGALGSANAEMLVRAGVKEITIIDRDYVDYSNLQRQQLYSERDVEDHLPKAIAAEKRLSQINSHVKITGVVDDFSAHNAEKLVSHVDLIIDGTDNFETRFLINDLAIKKEIPWIYGGCVGSYGMTFAIIPGKTPCLHCLLKELPLQGVTCETRGVISPVVQVVAAHQATLALKWMVGERIDSTITSFDLWSNQNTSMHFDSFKDEHCETCGRTPTYPYLQGEQTSKTAVLCGRDTVQIRSNPLPLQTIAKRIKPHVHKLIINDYLLSFSTDTYRIVLFQDGRALIHGTKNIHEAKTFYHKWIG
ncbi:ThiF family adenylyltransferase [Bacillus carboniphilus]|uniref:ThiF family adenylyltransferase n=1 Tax=Bacillus carboniphilus TaxID=86663 RepID=A0ABY9K0I8_9BACI|nr:ThiF family adenylyltransferase [Bacillus carboniphilus]WLR44233.1 ThiF family adenylyltransferase [Bacillus carboniphilus]